MTKQSPNSDNTPLQHLSLGKTVEYKQTYSPELLHPVARSLSRDEIGLNSDDLPFFGIDIWNGYELSWLNAKGKPQVAILQCRVPYDSPNLIESKSFKLYLNSFNQQKIEDVEDLQSMLEKDLSHCAGKPVEVIIVLPNAFDDMQIADLPGDNIDGLDIEIEDYDLSTAYLKLAPHEQEVEETLTSNLLKSNCLITNQPDWASIQIHYKGPKISHEGLLKYLISFRQHNEFHEQCVERVFSDILTHCSPSKLSVYARYTRRGGLDINPHRTNFHLDLPVHRQARQ